MIRKLAPAPPPKRGSGSGGSFGRVPSATKPTGRGSGLPVSLARGGNAEALLQKAHEENKKHDPTVGIRERKVEAGNLARLYEAVLRTPKDEGTARLNILDETQTEYDALVDHEIRELCKIAEVLHRNNFIAQEASEWSVLGVEHITQLNSIAVNEARRLEDERLEMERAKKLATREVPPDPILNSRILRRKLQIDVELQKREAIVFDELKRLDSSSLAKKNSEESRAARRLQFETLYNELDALVHQPATRDTSAGDIARLAEVTSRKLHAVQQESIKSAKKKDVRGDSRTPWEKDRDALITAIEQRIKKMIEMDERAAFRENEERQRVQRAKKLKVDMAVITGEKSVLGVGHQRELEMAKAEADAVVDEVLFRKMINVHGKEMHEEIKQHEKECDQMQKKLSALHCPLPDIKAGRWSNKSPGRKALFSQV